MRIAWVPDDAAQIVATMPTASKARLRCPSTCSIAGSSASATTGGANSMIRLARSAAAPGWPTKAAAADTKISSGNIASTEEKATLPAWLAPVQVQVLPVRSDHQGYAESLAERLRGEGFRVELADADEPLGARIRKAKLEKVPHVVVVGDDDVAGDTVGDNPRAGAVERDLPVASFVQRLHDEIAAHR